MRVYEYQCWTALEHTALNVVCNQEYAQAVPHVRIPRGVRGGWLNKEEITQDFANYARVSSLPVYWTVLSWPF